MFLSKNKITEIMKLQIWADIQYFSISIPCYKHKMVAIKKCALISRPNNNK